MEAEPQRDTGGSSPSILRSPIDTASHSDQRDEGSSGNFSTEVSNLPSSEHTMKQNDKHRNVSGKGILRSDESNSTPENDWEQANSKLHYLRRFILEELLQYLPTLRNIGKELKLIFIMNFIVYNYSPII